MTLYQEKWVLRHRISCYLLKVKHDCGDHSPVSCPYEPASHLKVCQQYQIRRGLIFGVHWIARVFWLVWSAPHAPTGNGNAALSPFAFRILCLWAEGLAPEEIHTDGFYMSLKYGGYLLRVSFFSFRDTAREQMPKPSCSCSTTLEKIQSHSGPLCFTTRGK